MSNIETQIDNGDNNQHHIFSSEDVSKHCNEQDCWLSILDGVYDVSTFSKHHPGGKVILGYGGGDATIPFNMSHKSALALQTLKKYRIGTLNDYQPSPIVEGIKQLTEDFKKKGYFTYSKIFLLFQFMQITLGCVIAYWIYWTFSGFLGVTAATVVLALAQGQAGWFMHDLGHFSVFKSTTMNRMVQYFVMNIFLGGSYSYWRNAHWKHHLFTNIEGWDHDLDSWPLFGWTQKMWLKLPFKRIALYQQYYYYIFGPAISFWYMVYLGINFYVKRKNYLTEGLGTVIHYFIFYLLLGRSLFATIIANLYVLLFLGIYMGHIFSLNHFPMKIEDKTEKKSPNSTQIRKIMKGDPISHQLKTTRNIRGSQFIDWFTGHLNYQIEHHVWPMMPRHNLVKIAPIFEKFCNQHNIPYESVGFFQALKDVFITLDSAIY
jgi:fatty acid desaturase